MTNGDLCESRADAVSRYNNGYYAEKLEQGLQFQDYVTRKLYQRGIVLVGYASRKYQIEKGENILGAEIKRDGNFRATGNLYLEIAEKSHPNNANYVPSGIMRDDNGWLFVIGDEETIYIFPTAYLRMMAEKKRWKEVKKTTSIGLLMPVVDADKYAVIKIESRQPSEADHG